MEKIEAEHDIDISILLATRGRPQFVQRLFKSLTDTAADSKALEIILYIDDDDLAGRQIDHDRLKVKKITGPRISMGAMHNECYKASRGGIILIIGDDNVFRTPGWDDTVRETFAKFPDEICLVYGNDLNQGRNMCTAPFLSRKYCEILGGPCPVAYTGEFVDTHIMDTFYKLRYWGYDRIIYLKNLIIEHMHHVVGKAPFDDTYANKAPTEENRNLFFSLDPLRVEQARALVRYLSNGRKV
jgi:hypothetical protein